MSDLLNSASLVMIPSGYKEDKVYSVVPSDGSGDMSFTRSSNATRVNSAGLVEVVAWNFNTNSENFTSNWGTDGTSTATNNFATAPNGTTTAAKVVANATNGYAYKFLSVPAGVYTLSFYVRASASGTMSIGINDVGGSGPNPKYNIPVTTEWQRIEHFANITLGTTVYIDYGSLQTGKDYFLWGAQLNIGSTAKPYFPTTDRLNVPRLTYQNGGGGCPSLLLEKQSTNKCLYSEQFDNAGWTKYTIGVGASQTITANYGISPDGTQNADRLQLTRGNIAVSGSGLQQTLTETIGATFTLSVWLKSLSGTPTICLGLNTTDFSQNVTLTTEWVRYTYTHTATSTTLEPHLTILGSNYTSGNSLSADFLAWGYQIETSSYPTSYIPTTSSSATRVADACFKTGISSLFGTNQGTFFIDFVYYGSEQFCYIFDVTDASNVNRFLMYDSNGSGLFYFYDDGYAVIDAYQLTKGQRYKIGVKYNSSGTIWYVNGVLSGTGTVSFVHQMSQLYLGIRYSITDNTGMTVNESIVFPTALSTTELASLTTI